LIPVACLLPGLAKDLSAPPHKYNPSLVNKFIPIRNKRRLDRKDTSKTKRAKFTYIGRETRYLTKHFKNHNLKMEHYRLTFD
jgi:hypothetical protein